jgi:uncharacterized protein YneF (UPF0154 family)
MKKTIITITLGLLAGALIGLVVAKKTEGL